jgi:hypothetical protein
LSLASCLHPTVAGQTVAPAVTPEQQAAIRRELRNDTPIQMMEERWVSPELRLMVSAVTGIRRSASSSTG